MQENQRELQPEQDEISLIDLIQILWKRRMLIIGGTLLATVAAAIISFLLPNIYEVSTIFEPGKIKAGKDKEEVYVVSPETLRESILGEAYDYKIRTELNIPMNEYPKIKATIPKNTSLIKVAIETSQPQISVDILTAMNKHIDAEINSRLEYEKKDIENQIKTALLKNKRVEEMVTLTKNQIDETYKKIGMLDKSRAKALSTSSEGAMHVLLYSNEIQNQQIYLNSLQEKLKNLEEEAKGADIRIDNLQLQLSRLKGMNVIKPVTVSDKPVRPKKALIVSVVFAIGLLVLVIVSFSLDFFERMNDG